MCWFGYSPHAENPSQGSGLESLAPFLKMDKRSSRLLLILVLSEKSLPYPSHGLEQTLTT